MNRPMRATLTVILVCFALTTPDATALTSGAGQKRQFILNPVGMVQKKDGRTTLVIRKELAPALLGLSAGKRIWVMYWFDKNDTPEGRAILRVHPRRNPANPLTGVFATRSPFRPNLIGLSLCKILEVKGNLVIVEKIDAFDRTPILDIKPYSPGMDTP